MTKEKEDISFKKDMNQQDYKNEITGNLQKREKLSYLIMKKFNISYDDAKRVVLKLEKNSTLTNSIQSHNHSGNSGNVISNQGSIKPKIQNRNIDVYSKEDNHKFSNTEQHPVGKKLVNETIKSPQKLSINKFELDLQKQKEKLKEFEKQQKEQQQKIGQMNLSNNVDSVLSDIMYDYANPCVIEFEDVNLTFNVDKERVDTLKEKFIRTLRQDKNKKMHIHALKDINFKIYKGEKIGIIGYNGAGKSTLLKVISGIFAPDSGTVNVEGNISPLLSLGAGFDFNYSGRRNIYLNGSILGYDKKFLEEKIDDIIEFSELGDYIDIPIKNYSSGMLAKLGFSIATMLNPEILIIDEILGVGDVNFRRKSADKIKSLMNTGCTVILVSHSIPQIRDLCDKAIWIDNGQVKEMGDVNQVCDNYMRNAEKASKEQLENIKFT